MSIRGIRTAACALAALFAAAVSSEASAQICAAFCPPRGGGELPPSGGIFASSQAGLLDLGTQYLQRLDAFTSFRSAAGSSNNPQGGGGDTTEPRYRTWFEGYGLRSRTDAKADFPGDHRRTEGAVAGVGATIAPGVTLGLSVDQSRTKIDVTGLPQHGTINLTQIGALGSFTRGAWQLNTMAIYGFGKVHSERFDAGGSPTAEYGARLWAAMAELNYYVALPDNFRIVPKLTFDGTRAHTDAFIEAGGALPIAGSAVDSSRVRMLLGAELGHTWLVDRTILDFMVYGRLVDNFLQDVGTLQVSDPAGTFTPQSVIGVRESTLGADGGAMFSAKLSETARVYVVYDGRFRSNFTSHSGTVGAEFRF